jgi:hypothetical protein
MRLECLSTFGEKVEPQRRRRAVLGTGDARCARLERAGSREYWPIWGGMGSPLSTKRRRELVADKLGSPSATRRKFGSLNAPEIPVNRSFEIWSAKTPNTASSHANRVRVLCFET